MSEEKAPIKTTKPGLALIKIPLTILPYPAHNRSFELPGKVNRDTNQVAPRERCGFDGLRPSTIVRLLLIPGTYNYIKRTLF